MNIEKLLDRFGLNWAQPHILDGQERKEARESVGPAWNKYMRMPIKLSIDDHSISRLCQQLTNQGYITFSSCEGHGREVPHIYFTCEDVNSVAELSDVVNKTAITHFGWGIGVYSLNHGDGYKAYYELRPERVKTEGLNIVESQEQLKEDFDILGYSITDHFCKAEK